MFYYNKYVLQSPTLRQINVSTLGEHSARSLTFQAALKPTMQHFK
jgi:hypothetical protein